MVLDGQRPPLSTAQQKVVLLKYGKTTNRQISMTHDASGQQKRADQQDSKLQIIAACDEIKELLLSKNAKYGDSALNPVRVFSKASTVEQLLVRIDDKLSRIKSGAGLIASDEDVLNDLIGYLFLLKIALNKPKMSAGSFSFSTSDEANGYWPNDPWDGIDLDNPYDFLNIQVSRSPD